MDLDTTLRNLPLTETAIKSAFETICSVQTEDGIVRTISESPEMNKRWENYVRQMPYAEGISFDDTLDSILCLML